ncbi:MAG: hypothetical protein M0P31_15345 [Solirubrobacteraceae bacterium]|nr:hypothetical protein [Solirubrobacteraceae bacterium]
MPIRSAAQAARIDHPTGTTAGLATPLAIVIVWLLGQFDLDMSPEVAAAVAALIVGIPAAIVSAFTPRFDAQLVLDDNDPPHGGTGPDPEEPVSEP